jgi:hypothetical protein
MKLSRAQILKNYDIRPKTLDVLLSGIIDDVFESSHGRRVLDISPQTDIILQCSRNSIQSFGYGSSSKGKIRGVHALPFHRFLALRFLTTPIDEIHDEIFQLGLMSGPKAFSKKTLKAIHKRFVDRLPDILKPLAKKQNHPKKKKEKEAYDSLLRVLNIKKFYDEPDIVEGLLFFMGDKPQVEMYLSTESAHKEIAHVMSSLYGITVSAAAMWSYRILFYSIHEISEADRDLYMLGVPPSERKRKKAALTKTVVGLAVALGVDVLSETRDVVNEIKKSAQKEFFNLYDQKTDSARQGRKHALDQFLKAEEYLEKHGGDMQDFSKIFSKFVIEKVPDNVISIEDIRNEKATGTK